MSGTRRPRWTACIAEQQRKLVARYGSISTVSIAVSVPKAPGPEAEEWIKATDKEFKGATRGSVVVVLERGLAAFAARDAGVTAA